MLHSFEIFPPNEVQKNHMVEKIVIQFNTERKSISDEEKKNVENVFRQEILDFEIMFSHTLPGSRIIKKLENIREELHQKFPHNSIIIALFCKRIFPKIYSGTRKVGIYF
jgi:hypothetical protein